MNFNGYINLFQLNGVEHLTVNGKACIVIPTGANNLQVQRNEQTGSLSCLLGIKADEVGDAYREKERENHRFDQQWDESKATSHQLIRTYNKEYREKLFTRLKEILLQENDEMAILERMQKVLRRDGSEGVASMENNRGWEKMLWQELDRRSRIGRLSANIQRNTTVNSAPAAQITGTAVPTNYQEEDDLPF